MKDKYVRVLTKKIAKYSSIFAAKINKVTEKRLQKLKETAKRRQDNLTVVLENVHDPHNIAAVLRTCDSVGIKEIFVLYTDPQLSIEQIKISKNTSSGARRWVDIHLYDDANACFQHIRKQYKFIFSTHLGDQPRSLYELDLTQSVALLFGNEHAGLSEVALANSDGNFIIPQMGLVQSLNISVACAVSIYEAFRQRDLKGMYDKNLPMTEAGQAALFDDFKRRQLMRDKRSVILKKT